MSTFPRSRNAGGALRVGAIVALLVGGRVAAADFANAGDGGDAPARRIYMPYAGTLEETTRALATVAGYGVTTVGREPRVPPIVELDGAYTIEEHVAGLNRQLPGHRVLLVGRRLIVVYAARDDGPAQPLVAPLAAVADPPGYAPPEREAVSSAPGAPMPAAVPPSGFVVLEDRPIEPSPLTGWTVQLPGRNTQADAHVLLARAREAGEEGAVFFDGDFWVARLGPYESRASAQYATEALLRGAGIDSLVVWVNADGYGGRTYKVENARLADR